MVSFGDVLVFFVDECSDILSSIQWRKLVTGGDLQAFITFAVATVLSLWALAIAVSSLFGERTARARERLEQSPVKVILLGAVIALVLGIVSEGMLSEPEGFLNLVGLIIQLLLLILVAIGFSGLSALVAQRLTKLDPMLTPYGALSRGALFCILATLVPVLGWFVIGPLIISASLGAGVKAVFSRAPAKASSQTTPNL